MATGDANSSTPRSRRDHAERTPAQHLPDGVADLVARNQDRRTARRAAWREHLAWGGSFQADQQTFHVARAMSFGRDSDGLGF
jgi:hypothetical protein